MLALPARFGAAAILGGGRQRTPWIHLDDAVRLVETALRDARYSGPINAVAPDLVTQGELTRALAFRFGTPQWLRVPAWPLRLLLGEMSDLFLAGQRVEPTRLKALGFQWTRPTLPDVFEPAAAPRNTARPSLAA
jgi:NAD dependent epimerase/dehydratase family enzyme